MLVRRLTNVFVIDEKFFESFTHLSLDTLCPWNTITTKHCLSFLYLKNRAYVITHNTEDSRTLQNRPKHVLTLVCYTDSTMIRSPQGCTRWFFKGLLSGLWSSDLPFTITMALSTLPVASLGAFLDLRPLTGVTTDSILWTRNGGIELLS